LRSFILKTIAIWRSAGANWVQGKSMREQPYWDDHAAFMNALYERGVVYLGGPFPDGGAMVVYFAASVEAAIALQKDDPWLKHGIHADAGAKEWTILLDFREKEVG
jgi:uncharacterized protein YciI